MTQVALLALLLLLNAALATEENIWIKLQKPVEQLALLGSTLISQTECVLNAAQDALLVRQLHFALHVMIQQDIDKVEVLALSARVHVLHAY